MSGTTRTSLTVVELASTSSGEQDAGAAARGSERILTQEREQETETGASDRPNVRLRNKKRAERPYISMFKGETAKMSGNVFQVHSERKNKSQ